MTVIMISFFINKIGTDVPANNVPISKIISFEIGTNGKVVYTYNVFYYFCLKFIDQCYFYYELYRFEKSIFNFDYISICSSRKTKVGTLVKPGNIYY